MLKKVPPAVILLGLVSFFNDIASEMIYPILPIFLTQVVGAPVFVPLVIRGFLWSAISPSATFFFGGICAILAFFLFVSQEFEKKGDRIEI